MTAKITRETTFLAAILVVYNNYTFQTSADFLSSCLIYDVWPYNIIQTRVTGFALQLVHNRGSIKDLKTRYNRR